jgi:hypothetical protein
VIASLSVRRVPPRAPLYSDLPAIAWARGPPRLFEGVFRKRTAEASSAGRGVASASSSGGLSARGGMRTRGRAIATWSITTHRRPPQDLTKDRTLGPQVKHRDDLPRGW